MTAKKIAKTATVGVAASNFDATTELGGAPGHSGVLIVSNFSSTAVVGVAWNGITAAIYGDDTRHIGPFGSIEIPFQPTISLISDTAATRVEIAGA